MVEAILRETFLFLLFTLSPLPLTTAQDTYYVRPNGSEATPPCEDCLTLSEYAREASTYFNSQNLTLVFLPGEHSLDTTIVFELLESVLLVGNTTSLPNITSKVVCSQQIAALSFTNVSKVEIKALAFASCGYGSLTPSILVMDLGTLLGQPENTIPAVSALFITNFYFTGCNMEHSYHPLLLNRSRVYLQNNTVQYNVGQFGGAIAAYNSILVFLGQNTFQYNHAEVGGGVFAKGSDLTFSGLTTFIGNGAIFGGGGICAVNSSMSYNESLHRELLWPYDPNVCTYMWNIARYGGGVLLAHSTMKLRDGTLKFTANNADNGGGIYSNFSTIMLEGNVVFRDNSAKRVMIAFWDYNQGFGGAAFLHFSTWTTTAITFTGNSAEVVGGAIHMESSQMKFTGISNKFMYISEESFFEACTCLVNNSAGSGGGLSIYSSTVEFDGNTFLEGNSAHSGGGGGIAARSNSKLHFKHNTTFAQNSVGLEDYAKLMGLIAGVSMGGGGLSTSSTEIIFEGHTSFKDNFAKRGGGLEVGHSPIVFSGETTFVGNHVFISGGGLYMVNCSLNASGNGSFVNNIAFVAGGAVNCVDNASLIFEGEYTFMGNEALYGGAISVNKAQATISGKNCLVENRAVYGGAIFAKESIAIELFGEVSFISNAAVSVGYGGYGGGIHAMRTRIVSRGVLNFTNNSAWYGGGLSLTDCDSDHFIFISQANILFFSNFAQNRGGAVLIEDAPIDYCVSDFIETINAGSCFFKFLNTKHTLDAQQIQSTYSSTARNDVLREYVRNCTSSITFEDNFAKQGGNTIYGGALHVCRVLLPLEVPYLSPKPQLCGEEGDVNIFVSGLEAVAALMDMTQEQMTANPRSIASDPFKVCICDNMRPNCSQRAIHNLFILERRFSFQW